MAAGEAGEGPSAPAPPAPGDDGTPLVGFWPAVLVALVAAFLAWLWYGRGDGDGGGKGPEAPRAQEPLQKSCEPVVSEGKQREASQPREPVENQLGPPVECPAPSFPEESPETESVQSGPSLMNCKETVCYPAMTSEPPQSEESAVHNVSLPAEAGPSSEKHEERCKAQWQHSSVDHEEWEVVPEHSAWGGDGARKSSTEDASCKDLDQARRVAAVSPMPQTVHVLFRVHYITHSEAQLIAITGDHECLGQWQHYVPLRCDKYGFWSDSVVLPVDTRVEWKFIVVENGKVRRWEECDNRVLTTDHQDRVAHKWWGYH
ncbi:hypothetical protein JRQ81_016978 [Phrynocephalus forsythii]|uniref:Starch-binding domain-containing protein 1 n=1 Tax=Phrynocephalus forsythii TaxID=171643 RepID=A0A9Q1B132_9SAUR|nr:hypothetical protein JRQ81_016978 [Phrynocephalus forsythii]